MEQVVIGYVYNSDGCDIGHYFESTAENIASFIMSHNSNFTVITDIMDQLYVSSMPGGYLDKMDELYKDRLPMLIKAILPKQYNQKEPSKILFLNIAEETKERENLYDGLQFF